MYGVCGCRSWAKHEPQRRAFEAVAGGIWCCASLRKLVCMCACGEHGRTVVTHMCGVLVLAAPHAHRYSQCCIVKVESSATGSATVYALARV